MDRVQHWQDGVSLEDSMSFTPATTREVTIKLLVLGDVMVGKTSLVQRYVNNVFQTNYKETIGDLQTRSAMGENEGLDFTMKVIQWTPNLTLKLQFWDIAGNERMGTMTRAYYRNAQGCVLMFDLTDHSTFYRAASWKEDLDSKWRLSDGSPLPCLLVGNKSDVANEWSVGRDDIDSMSKRLGFCAWRVVSVKDNIGVDEALRFLVQTMMAQSSSGRNEKMATNPQRRESTSIVLSRKPVPTTDDSGCAC